MMTLAYVVNKDCKSLGDGKQKQGPWCALSRHDYGESLAALAKQMLEERERSVCLPPSIVDSYPVEKVASWRSSCEHHRAPCPFPK